jgi:hypothetical protein
MVIGHVNTSVNAWQRAATVAAIVGMSISVQAQTPDQDQMELFVRSGRTLRLSLDETITVKRVGQTVTATLVDPVYAYDRLVLPVGVKAVGRIAALEPPRGSARARAALAGNFSPARHVVLRFDTLILEDGHRITMETLVTNGTENVVRQIAGGRDAAAHGAVRNEIVGRAKEAVAGIKGQAQDALSAIKRPAKMERLKRTAIDQLPYHPQFLNKGTIYSAALLSHIPFGSVTPRALAPTGTRPAPGSILKARLDTAIDSARTPRGTAVVATLTEPVFSAQNELILPEGTALTGTVTFAKQARRLHRNGQLRFLFEQIRPPAGKESPLLASLYSVEIGQQDRVSLDDEGGARVTNSKTRFVAPAVAILALRAGASEQEIAGSEAASEVGPAVNGGASAVGGALGFGLIGAGLSQVSRPFGITVGVIGAVRTLYTNVFGRGREVSFPANTPIEVQLAPGPTADQ